MYENQMSVVSRIKENETFQRRIKWVKCCPKVVLNEDREMAKGFSNRVIRGKNSISEVVDMIV